MSGVHSQARGASRSVVVGTAGMMESVHPFLSHTIMMKFERSAKCRPGPFLSKFNVRILLVNPQGPTVIPRTYFRALVQSDGSRSVMGIPGQIGLYLSYVIDPITPTMRAMTWNCYD